MSTKIKASVSNFSVLSEEELDEVDHSVINYIKEKIRREKMKKIVDRYKKVNFVRCTDYNKFTDMEMWGNVHIVLNLKCGINVAYK